MLTIPIVGKDVEQLWLIYTINIKREREGFFNFKKLPYFVFIEVGKSKMCKEGWRDGDLGKS